MCDYYEVVASVREFLDHIEPVPRLIVIDAPLLIHIPRWGRSKVRSIFRGGIVEWAQLN